MLRDDGLVTVTLGKALATRPPQPSSNRHPRPAASRSPGGRRNPPGQFQQVHGAVVGGRLAAGLRKVGGTVGCSRLSATFTQDRSCNGCRLKKRWRCKDLADGTVVAPAISSHPVSNRDTDGKPFIASARIDPCTLPRFHQSFPKVLHSIYRITYEPLSGRRSMDIAW